MATMLIAANMTRECGQFCGDQLCSIKTAYLMVQNRPQDTDKIIVALSPGNEMHFLWSKFIEDPAHDGSLPPCEVVMDSFQPGNHDQRWEAWDRWRSERHIEGRKFNYYRELYLRIHGGRRQGIICGSERGLCRKNIYEYLLFGQENMPESCVGSDWFDDTLIHHPPHRPERDVYISPHCKTQGNFVFTFEFWSRVVHNLVRANISVTVGYDGYFCEELNGHPMYAKHWGDHRAWMEVVCRHKLVSCGNTGTGWLAAACGVPLLTMEPPNSIMADHRYRECGLKNLVEVVDVPDPDYVSRRICEEVNRVVVLTTGCYDVLHSGHVRHLQRARAMGTRLVVALNSDSSVRRLKGEGRPVNPQDQRRAVLEALRCVDEVRVFDGDDALDVIGAVKPAVLACGFGYKVDDIVGKDLVESFGGRAVVTCTGDASTEPSTTKILSKLVKKSDVVEAVMMGAQFSVNHVGKLQLLAEQFLSVSHLPGDVADLGAYRGGTSVILRRLAPDKHLHLFDTWTGNPFDETGCHHGKGSWPADLSECKRVVGTVMNTADKTHYRQGVFPDTMAVMNWSDGKLFSFVYVDPDTYRTVRDAIEFFWPYMVPGGKMVFDDYGWTPCPGVKIAVDEAFTSDQRQVFQEQHTCVVVKK